MSETFFGFFFGLFNVLKFSIQFCEMFLHVLFFYFSFLSLLFFNSLLFSATLGLFFSFFNLFLNLSLYRIIKVLNIYRFLLLNVCFFSNRFVISWVFPYGSFHLHFIFVRFKHNVKVTFEVKTSFLFSNKFQKTHLSSHTGKLFCSYTSYFVIICSFTHQHL